ncbi:hypothetical protein ACOMHN_004818 [Nucella lapillus]
MRRQREPDTPTPGDPYPPPSPPGSASVWVGASNPGQHVSRIHNQGSSTGGSFREDHQESDRHGSGSAGGGDGDYVVISVRNSVSDSSESGSRRSSGTRTVSQSSVGPVTGSGHSRTSSNSSSGIDPFSPTSPHGVDPGVYGQNVGVAGGTGNPFGTASLGNLGSVSNVFNGSDVQNLALAGNMGNTNFLTSPTFAGNTGQNAVFFPNSGNLPNMALGANTSDILAANPGLLYNGTTFVPTASSSVGMLPQGGYDPSSLLLQQQLALNPDLLAAILGQTLTSLPQTQPVPQNLDLLQAQTSLAQGQTVAHSLGFSQAQPTPQSLNLLQAQAALSQAQPLPANLDLLQAQTFLQNLSLAQVGNVPQNLNPSLSQAGGTAQNLNFPQAQNPDPCQVTAQSLGTMLQPQTSLPQAAAPWQQMPISQSYPAPDSLDDYEQPEVTSPQMGHSFEVLTTIVALNQARLSTHAQSPTTPEMPPAVVSPQLVPADGTSGFTPSLTGLSQLSSDALGDHHHQMPHTSSETAGVPSHLHVSSSSDNGDDQTTSGMGSSVSSDSNPTSPNADLHLMASEDKGNVQHVHVDPCYDRPWDKGACLRCGKKVYTMEKVGPVKDVLYHKTCFTCVACHTKLNLKNFHYNDADLADLNVYCVSHKPTAHPKPLDSSSVGIKRALTVPRPAMVNEQIRGGPAGRSIRLDSVTMRSALHAPAPDLQASIKQREGAWFREERKYERMPPEDVVRHDEQKYEGSLSLYSSTR